MQGEDAYIKENIMKITTNSTEILEWDIQDCEAQASIKSENNSHTFDWIVIKKKDSTILDMARDEETLRSIHKAIGDLIDHLDRKRGVGHQLPHKPAGIRTFDHPMWAMSEEKISQ